MPSIVYGKEGLPLRKAAFLARIVCVAYLFSGCASLRHTNAEPTLPPVQTQGVAPAPTVPPQSLLGRPEAKYYKALASRVRACQYAQAKNTIDGKLYIGCSEGNIVALDARGNVIASGNVPMYGINAIVPAGESAIAVFGVNDGAALRDELSLLRATTLKPIVQHFMTDSTFLGVIGDRAYIDDWCCNGRADVYQPATIYWISLRDGTESQHIDLAPDPQGHPGNLQPVGQGEHNYLIGNYFYVVVGPVTYRYDVRNLQKPPNRMATPGAVR